MSTKLMLIVCLALAGLLHDVSSETTCTYIFYQQVKSETRCGRFGWQRCTTYRTVSNIGTRPCNMTTTTPAPINGGWTEYEETGITACSASCGNGTQIRTLARQCTNPAPSNGGSDCEGNSTRNETIDCNIQPCPVNGGWSDWSEWEDKDECSVFCGTGELRQSRSRTCDNSAPAFGGADCSGGNRQNRTVDCNTDDCGDQCPLNVVKYFPHPNNTMRFYQCDNGVARLQNCAPSTVWKQAVLTCIHPCVPDDHCSNGKSLTADPTDCTKFYHCKFGERCGPAMHCSLGLAFNPAITNCDFRHNVPAC